MQVRPDVMVAVRLDRSRTDELLEAIRLTREILACDPWRDMDGEIDWTGTELEGVLDRFEAEEQWFKDHPNAKITGGTFWEPIIEEQGDTCRKGLNSIATS